MAEFLQEGRSRIIYDAVQDRVLCEFNENGIATVTFPPDIERLKALGVKMVEKAPPKRKRYD